MEYLEKQLEDVQREKQKNVQELQKVESEIIAKMFYKKGWDDRGDYEEEKRASEAGRVLANHKKKSHSN